MDEKKDHTDAWIKHLEMIQDVIARQAGAAAWTKRLSLIIVGATVAFLGRNGEHSPSVVWMAMGLVVVFWVIDARYYQQELWFRGLFDEVRNRGNATAPDFDLTPSKELRARHQLIDAMAGWSTRLLYGALLVYLFLFGLAL